MKKILFALLIPVLSIAQEEKINFTHKLTYFTNPLIDSTDINIYHSKDGSLVEMMGDNILFKNKLSVPIKINIEGDLKAYNKYNIDSIPSFTLSKTQNKAVINGIPCNYYKAINNKEMYKESGSMYEVCISENHPIDLLATIPITNKNIKGLILRIDDYYDRNHFIELKSINNVKLVKSLNWKKFEEEYTDYITQDKESEPQDTDFMDSDSIDYGILKYNSQYKVIKTKEMDLAVELLENDSPYWQGIPQYCSNLENIVTRFSDKELKEHAKNYAGQICDLYLSEVKEYSVDVKSTLDAIRYEENYFMKHNISKKERKLLTEFLDELD